MSDTVSSTIALINYGMGNLRSVANALETSGASVRLCTRPEDLKGADGVVLPGVGALGDCVSALRDSGMDRALINWIANDRPFLGVCLGLQALFERSEEGDVAGLGVFPGRVVRFRLPSEFKVPHMGWNKVRFTHPGSPLCQGLSETEDQFYFVHSYHVVPDDSSIIFSVTDYGGDFVSAVSRGRCFATQFHPEKSQSKGLTLYRNFVRFCAAAEIV